MDKILVAWMSLAVLNVGVFWILVATLRGVNVKDALREKDPKSQPVVALGAAQGQGAGDAALANTSYSRLSGYIGSIVLACFLWAVGNYVLYASFFDPNADDIPKYLQSISSYFLSGAALFAPYAVNKLSTIFKSS